MVCMRRARWMQIFSGMHTGRCRALLIKHQLAGYVLWGGAPVDGEVEIGYGLFSSMEKQGFMTEAVLCMADWLKEQGVHTLCAGCGPENTASRRVLERCRFELHGTDEEGVCRYQLDLEKREGD